MLAEWKLGGWAAMMGRHPESNALIVPMPPEHAARRRTRTGEAFRGHDYSGERWRRDDLPVLGWRHRRHYDMRATFITRDGGLRQGRQSLGPVQALVHRRDRQGVNSSWSVTLRNLRYLRYYGAVTARDPVDTGEIHAPGP